MFAHEKFILGRVAHAIERYQLIEDGDRVLVAASAGKDSTTMAYALAALLKTLKIHFTLHAVRIAADFVDNVQVEPLRKLFTDWGIALEEIPVNVLGRLKPGEKMNCYWCSGQRRMELMEYARVHGYNKIALGHHLDDILETLFMNMTQKGELASMPVRIDYDKYPISIIRPLALVEERQIIGFAESYGFRSITCSCDYGQNSKRRVMREKIAVFTGNDSAVKNRIFESLHHVKLDYLTVYGRS